MKDEISLYRIPWDEEEVRAVAAKSLHDMNDTKQNAQYKGKSNEFEALCTIPESFFI